jgi:hypothetical protein
MKGAGFKTSGRICRAFNGLHALFRCTSQYCCSKCNNAFLMRDGLWLEQIMLAAIKVAGSL